MAITDRKRKTDYEWKKKNKTNIGCTVYRKDAEDFKAYAAARGKSVNELFKEYVSSCLGRPLEKREGPKKKIEAEIIEEYPED